MATATQHGPCARCGEEIRTPQSTIDTGIGGTGYVQDSSGSRYCYPCCGEREREAMIESGRAVLYLAHDGSSHRVSDWPGTLSFRVLSCHRIRHNMAREGYACRFVGPDGYIWSGRNIGDDPVLRARRTKERA